MLFNPNNLYNFFQLNLNLNKDLYFHSNPLLPSKINYYPYQLVLIHFRPQDYFQPNYLILYTQ